MSKSNSVERPVEPRVRTVFQDDDSGHYRYRGHEVEISYEQPRDCWYIVVTAPNGVKAYDGPATLAAISVDVTRMTSQYRSMIAAAPGGER